MSGEVNMIPTLRQFRGGASPSKFRGGQSRGEAQLKKNTLYFNILNYIFNIEVIFTIYVSHPLEVVQVFFERFPGLRVCRLICYVWILLSRKMYQTEK